MIVECPSCKSRYTLSPALITGSRGVLVRCRKCGDRFEVRNPEMPSPTEPLESPPHGTGKRGRAAGTSAGARRCLEGSRGRGSHILAAISISGKGNFPIR
ncbi:zinc-ribbon domain-containing protein [bacterium]|nr:zinc-ribbon domain-containing protein [bacterium]